MNSKMDIGVIGLAVMGENLILNMESKGFRVVCFNRTTQRVDTFIQGRASGRKIFGAHSLEALCGMLTCPRKVMMMVKAGDAVDTLIAQLIPLLEPGDVIIDGGNSNYQDTERRVRELESKGILFIGTGVSGGEEGALTGPSMMPGGSANSWQIVAPIFRAICAKTDRGEPCCSWIGKGGAGHFVKMIHNGIEYGDMQLITEAYQLMRDGAGLSNDQMSEVFAEWNQGELDSYLIEITRDILRRREADGSFTVDKILDAAGQKGTGKWTVEAAMEFGQTLTLIAEAVFSRSLSALKEERVAASLVLKAGTLKPPCADELDKNWIQDLQKALYASKIISYAQGFSLMRAASNAYDWNLDYGSIALAWRGGCIIRSVFLDRIKEAFVRQPDLANLMLDSFFNEALTLALPSWRRTVIHAISIGIPIPAMVSALAYYDGYRHERLSANLLQAQRDYFGAHTYERIDHPRGEFFHTDWVGLGGDVTASTYNV